MYVCIKDPFSYFFDKFVAFRYYENLQNRPIIKKHYRDIIFPFEEKYTSPVYSSCYNTCVIKDRDKTVSQF